MLYLSMNPYIRPSVSNGIPREQAMIRRWWMEAKQGKGDLVFEYFLEGRYADAIWFPTKDGNGNEFDGKRAPGRFPLAGREVVLCEAKESLTPELIGQALVYAEFVREAGARLQETVIFAERCSPTMVRAAEKLGLTVFGSETLDEPNDI